MVAVAVRGTAHRAGADCPSNRDHPPHLIHKHGEIGRCLAQLELEGLTERERSACICACGKLIAQIWFRGRFRLERPTPGGRAKWGFAVVEDSCGGRCPEFLRHLDRALYDSCGEHLPLDISPVSFVSWMGGDRDGNPNVTALSPPR